MYEKITYEVILQRMLDRIPNDFDKREGSVIYDALAPAAIELQLLYIELDTIMNEAFGDTATREYLIRRAAERGLKPFPGTNAVLQGEFMPADLPIPIGARFNLDKLNYVVIEKVSNGMYKVMCETPGILGNQYLGDLIPIDYISGLELAKLTALLIPGEDEEDTEHLRTRYFESFDSQAFGGNVKDYKEKVNSLHGVGGVKVYREWNGDIRPADFCPPDSFQGWFSGLGGETPREVSKWLDIINKAATEGLLTVGGTVRLVIIDSTFSVPSKLLVDTVQTHIDPLQNAGEGVGIAPIGHVVKVEGVGADTVNFRFNLTYRDGWTGADVEAYVKEIIHEYFTELAETWANQEEALVVRISQVESRLLGIEGVLDVADTTINGVASNYTLPLDYIPILGTITV